MSSSLITSIHHLRAAREYIDDFIRSYPNSRGSLIFTGYKNKIDWILRDVITYPHFSPGIREAIKIEITSDALQYPAIMDRISLLTPDKREELENIVEELIYRK
jgi:hypothetical protein